VPLGGGCGPVLGGQESPQAFRRNREDDHDAHGLDHADRNLHSAGVKDAPRGTEPDGNISPKLQLKRLHHPCLAVQEERCHFTNHLSNRPSVCGNHHLSSEARARESHCRQYGFGTAGCKSVLATRCPGCLMPAIPAPRSAQAGGAPTRTRWGWPSSTSGIDPSSRRWPSTSTGRSAPGAPGYTVIW
jgi:hypothetical protein